jgi:hypothetical protein
MSILITNKSIIASKIWFEEDKMCLLLQDGRESAVPID